MVKSETCRSCWRNTRCHRVQNHRILQGILQNQRNPKTDCRHVVPISTMSLHPVGFESDRTVRRCQSGVFLASSIFPDQDPRWEALISRSKNLSLNVYAGMRRLEGQVRPAVVN